MIKASDKIEKKGR